MLRSKELARLEVDRKEKKTSVYNGRVDEYIDANDDRSAVEKESWGHCWFGSCKTTTLCPCKETEACESDEKGYECVSGAPAISGSGVCESVKYRYGGSGYDAVANEVHTLDVL